MMAALAGLFGATESYAAACGKDIDCKGSRVCEGGQCITPESLGARTEPTHAHQSVVDAERQPVVDAERQPVADAEYDVQEHDGFYLRLGVGLGLMRFSEEGHDSLTSAAGLTELAIGGTVAEGLALGGGAYSGFADLEGFYQLSVYALSVDYYVDATEGLHVQTALGIALGKSSDQEKYASGLGLVLGLGDEWWVGDQWSAGLLGRVQYVRLREPNTDDWEDQSIVVGALATLTYH